MEKESKKGSKRSPPSPRSASWEKLARWYDGWVGPEGSDHHRQLAIPTVLELLNLQPGERLLDLGAGSGVLAPHVFSAGASYTGVDLSRKMLEFARRYHGKQGRFLVGDSRRLASVPGITAASFDAATFLLSIQDINPLEEVLHSAAWALKPGGRLVILMTHPCFRVPRQSGWGWDEGRKLRFRRVDRYLTALAVPLKAYPGAEAGVSRSFHRPLEDYINGLGECGLLVDCLREVPGFKVTSDMPDPKAAQTASEEIPLFLGLRARKLKS